MIIEHRNKAVIGLTFWALITAGTIVAAVKRPFHSSANYAVVMLIALLFGEVVFFWGSWHLAKAKGYSGRLSLFSVLGPLAHIALLGGLLALPDRNRQRRSRRRASSDRSQATYPSTKETSQIEEWVTDGMRVAIHRRKARWWLAGGTLLIALAVGLFLVKTPWFPTTDDQRALAVLIFIAGYLGFITGCSWLAKAKGWHEAVVLIGLSPLLLILPLRYLPGRRLLLLAIAPLVPYLMLFMPAVLFAVIVVLPDKMRPRESRRMKNAASRRETEPPLSRPSRSRRSRRIPTRYLRWAGIATGIVVTAGIAVTLFVRAGDRHELYIVNGYTNSVRIYRPDQGMTDYPPGVTRLRMKGSRFSADVSGPVKEHLELVISNAPGIDVNPKAVYVINLGAEAVLAEAEFPPGRVDIHPRIHAHYGQSILTFSHVDYPFHRVPDPVPVEEDRKFAVGLILYHGEVARLLEWITEDQGPSGRTEFAEWWLERHPGDEELPPLYASGSIRLGQAERAATFLRQRMAAEPENPAWHRAYFSLNRSANENAYWRGEYDKRLKLRPQDSTLLYLRGAVSPDPGEGRGFFQRSIGANSSNVYALHALATDFLLGGQYAEAEQTAAQAARLRPRNSELAMLNQKCQMQNGSFELLESRYRSDLVSRPLDYDSAIKLCDLLALQDRPAKITPVVEAFREAAEASHQPGPKAEATLLDLSELYLRGEYLLLEKKSAAVAQPGARKLHFQALIELGKLAEAANAPRSRDPSTDAVEQLSLGVAWSLERKPDLAELCFSNATEPLLKLNPAAAELLRRKEPPSDSAIALVRLQPLERSILLAALARRHPSLADRLNAEAIRAAQTRFPPHALIARAATLAPAFYRIESN